MKGKILFLSIFVLSLMVSVLFTVSINSLDEEFSLLLQNVEALADDENGGLDTKYVRHDNQTCSIYVGAKGSITLLGGTILRADANGYVIFDGKVWCDGGGNSSCKPVECVDLYTSLFIKP